MIPILLDKRAAVVKTGETTSLVISDLHLGYHISLAERVGVDVHSQHHAMRDQIKELIERYNSNRLFIIGDVKHTIEMNTAYNWKIVPEFMEELLELVSVTVVPGNHDGGIKPLLPRGVQMTDVQGAIIDQNPVIGLIHGHAWPSEEVLRAEIIISGHGHPAIERVKRVRLPRSEAMTTRRSERIPVVIQSRLDKNCIRHNIGSSVTGNDTEAILINIPSFNPMVSGVAINKQGGGLVGPIFSKHCVDILRSKVFSTNGILLGTVKALQSKYQM